MTYYIYLTTNLINGKKYIGQHKGELSDNYFGSGSLISKAIEKYGKENFTKEILYICKSREEADAKEKEIIAQYGAVNSKEFYNLQEGGTGGDGWRASRRYFEEHPEEAKKIWKQNGEKLQQWRIEHPEEYQEKAVKPMLAAAHKWAKEHPEEVAKNMKKVNEKKEEWQRAHPEEHQAQVNAWRKKGSEANSMAVICLTTGEEFESISAAARYYNIAQPNISKCLKGERQSAGKHPETKEKLRWKLK